MTRLAISLDPTFAVAYASAANIFGQTQSLWMDRGRGQGASWKAVSWPNERCSLTGTIPWCLPTPHKCIRMCSKNRKPGSALAAKAVALDPNLTLARLWAGWALSLPRRSPHGDSAIPLAAIRLSPIDPHLFLPQTGMAYAHFFAGEYEESLSRAASAMQRQQNFPGAQRIDRIFS